MKDPTNEAILLALLTKSELAARLKLTPRTIENLMAKGLPHFKLGSRRARFDWEQVRKYLDDKFSVTRGA